MKALLDDKVPCKCCGGICPWHAEHGAHAENDRSYECDCGAGPRPSMLEPGYLEHAHKPECASEWSVPGCWSCCGSGCRSCGSTGFIPLERAIFNLERQIASDERSVERTVQELAQRRVRLAELKARMS